MADRTLLFNLADRLDQFPQAPMTERLAKAQALVVTEAAHGPGAYSEYVEHHLVTHLPPIERGITRGEYAARLRLVAQEVAA